MSSPRIAIVGDCWDLHEEKAQTPFSGPAGYYLNEMLAEAEIDRADCHVTTVFQLRPPNDDIKNLCGSKAETRSELPALVSPGKYLDPTYLSHLGRLYSELSTVRPNLVVTLGGPALWAFTGVSGIAKNRGAILAGRPLHSVWSRTDQARLDAGMPPNELPVWKILPTYHPSDITRQYSLRPIIITDFMKAKRQAAFPEIRRPERHLMMEPTVDDLRHWYELAAAAPKLSVDIETAHERITCIGFAVSATQAFVIPFHDTRRGGNYWQSSHDEMQAWGVVRAILNLRNEKLFQNGLYDVHWLWRRYGIPVRNFARDTMLKHHALQPEFQKGLGFLGACYTDEPAWKLQRPKGGNKKAMKKEDL